MRREILGYVPTPPGRNVYVVTSRTFAVEDLVGSRYVADVREAVADEIGRGDAPEGLDLLSRVHVYEVDLLAAIARVRYWTEAEANGSGEPVEVGRLGYGNEVWQGEVTTRLEPIALGAVSAGLEETELLPQEGVTWSIQRYDGDVKAWENTLNEHYTILMMCARRALGKLTRESRD